MMTFRELRAWLDAKARDYTQPVPVWSAFYELQQTFESDFNYPLGSVVFDARNALEYHAGQPEVVAAYQEFLDRAATVTLTPEEKELQTPTVILFKFHAQED